MTKVTIKNENITPFGGIFHVKDLFYLSRTGRTNSFSIFYLTVVIEYRLVGLHLCGIELHGTVVPLGMLQFDKSYHLGTRPNHRAIAMRRCATHGAVHVECRVETHVRRKTRWHISEVESELTITKTKTKNMCGAFKHIKKIGP